MAKIIEDNVLTGLINYLMTRPYQEVAAVMPILLKLPDATPVGAAGDIASIEPPKES